MMESSKAGLCEGCTTWYILQYVDDTAKIEVKYKMFNINFLIKNKQKQKI